MTKLMYLLYCANAIIMGRKRLTFDEYKIFKAYERSNNQGNFLSMHGYVKFPPKKRTFNYKGVSTGLLSKDNYLCTCVHCDKKDTCEFAYDPYNTLGDCLADK
jgi:hypothetical protein